MARPRTSTNKKRRTKRTRAGTGSSSGLATPPGAAAQVAAEHAPDSASAAADEGHADPALSAAASDGDLEDREEEEEDGEEATVSADGRSVDGAANGDGGSEDAAATDRGATNGTEKYSVDVPSTTGGAQCDTEDQLEDIYTRADDHVERAQDADAEATPDDAGLGSAAELTDLEDSEAVLLASNLDDSMYHSHAGSSFVDEVHAIEESQHISEPSSADHGDEAVEAEAAEEPAARKYVVTPSAFAAGDEPETIAHIRPPSAACDPPSDAEAASSSDHPTTVGVQAVADSFVHVGRALGGEAADERPLDDAGTNADPMSNRDESKKAERAANKAIDDTKSAAKDTANKASKAVKDAADDISSAADSAAAKAKDVLDDAEKSARKTVADANAKAQSAMGRAKESSERFARKALDEANEAEKALEKQAKATSPAVLRTLGVLAAALAAVSGYYFRLPGRDNQRIGFAGGVASAIIGLGTLATAFIRRNT
ncbi:hypothetical protein LPJ61_000155 [Coemansia biformis]|uniref:Uncharacterized protein n=1 Tax=Coemansia biformis TaxID=1286918 RepID=A0A9W7YHJ9_9FUNG|nr:hypothetical protein LPJ61_000155 [Coemansia biformis]